MNENLVNLEGSITKIIFANSENNFTVAKFLPNDESIDETIVGTLIGVNIGEQLKIWGKWINNKKFGKQFEINNYIIQSPNSLEAIKKYLSSGFIKGIGETMAERIVDYFKLDTLNIIENHPHKLTEVDGIGKKKSNVIIESMQAQKGLRDLVFFLNKFGIGANVASKVWKKYGNKAIKVLEENPYKLASDIGGIGFKTADQIARKLGIPEDSINRGCASILFGLKELGNKGHVYAPRSNLISHVSKLININSDVLFEAINKLQESREIYVDKKAEEDDAIYLKSLYDSEILITKKIIEILNAPGAELTINQEKAVNWVSRISNVSLTNEQKETVLAAIKEKIVIITGGPGTGKTTIVNSIVKIFDHKQISCALAAPTGRAAKRLEELTGKKASTIHRLLKYSPGLKQFTKDENDPFEYDVIIIDETSMIDTNLFSWLIKACDKKTKLILVGDVNQLPSIGPGNILKDLIESELIKVIKLTAVFRQQDQSLININAHKINQGFFPLMPSVNKLSDFYFIEEDNPNKIFENILDLTLKRIPEKFKIDPFDIQIITPMHKGDIGALRINSELQNILTKGCDAVIRGTRSYRVGDKVMQITNNYDKDVFNGDIGVISKIDKEEGEIFVSYNERVIGYDTVELDEITLSYAITVHKSQGCEYPAIVIPIHTQHYMMLQRNLLYTAITRGEKLVIIVGSRKALEISIKNNFTHLRFSSLRDRLRQFR